MLMRYRSISSNFDTLAQALAQQSPGAVRTGAIEMGRLSVRRPILCQV